MRRTMTATDALAETHLQETIVRSPTFATQLGISSDAYDDFSPAGLAARADLARTTLATLEKIEPVDSTDRVTASALCERLGLEIEMHEAHTDLASLNGIVSGLHAIQECYDLMATDTDEDWAVVARRLHRIPEAVDGWFASQLAAVDYGIRPAARQVTTLVEQVAGWIAPDGYFDRFVASAGDRPKGLAEDLASGLASARQGFRSAVDRLRGELGPLATEVDGVGRERYLLASREFLGTTINIDETYAWGLAEVAKVQAEQRTTAGKIVAGGSVADAMAALDADPRYRLNSTAELQRWMQTRADEAIARLVDGGHFVIPEQLRRIDCRIADTTSGGIYYTSPSEDFSRPGTMWWSVPLGVTSFTTWRELTTVYHEGAPGHHLQHAFAMANQDLNRWRQNGVWVSGHGEGWALYAERLMAELGFLDDPGMYMGLLDSQALRATRVVLDIGVHCGLPAPGEVGGGAWTFEKAWEYFNSHVSMPEANARFEVLRYFGWPGQAPSYRIGEQRWLDLREQARAAAGDGFDLIEFHSRALSLGALGLDTLTEAVLEQPRR